MEVLPTEVERVDVEGKKVVTEDLVIPYDFLIVARGARHSYFGHDEWEQDAPGLKTLADAVRIRQKLLVAFELAEKAIDPAERDAALTFVIVGGGPTGVEMAGAISEIARHTMTKDFRRIDSRKAKIIVIEGAPHILGAFPESLAANAKRQLAKVGVEVREGVRVTNVTPEGVEVKDGPFIPARTVFWAAGTHLFYLVGYRSRIAVMAEWVWNYFSFYRGSRLITGEQNGEYAPRHPQAGSSTALQRNPGLSTH